MLKTVNFSDIENWDVSSINVIEKSKNLIGENINDLDNDELKKYLKIFMSITSGYWNKSYLEQKEKINDDIKYQPSRYISQVDNMSRWRLIKYIEHYLRIDYKLLKESALKKMEEEKNKQDNYKKNINSLSI